MFSEVKRGVFLSCLLMYKAKVAVCSESHTKHRCNVITMQNLNVNRLVFITEAESVYSAVRTESLYNTVMSRP